MNLGSTVIDRIVSDDDEDDKPNKRVRRGPSQLQDAHGREIMELSSDDEMGYVHNSLFFLYTLFLTCACVLGKMNLT